MFTPVQDMLDRIIDTHRLCHMQVRRLYIAEALYLQLCEELRPAANISDSPIPPAIPPSPKPSEYRGVVLMPATWNQTLIVVADPIDPQHLNHFSSRKETSDER